MPEMLPPDSADECYRCGYDLRGISDDQPCPECGLLAERSRRETEELHNARPRWLRRLSLGVWLILGALLFVVVWISSVAEFQDKFASYVYSTYGYGIYRVYYKLSFWGGFGIAAILLISGVWLLTTREGYAPSDRADRWQRRVLRAFSFAPLLAWAGVQVSAWISATLLYSFLSQPASPPFPDWAPHPVVAWLCDWMPLGLATIGTVPLPLLLFFRLRNLAKRARSAHLAEHCAIVGIGMSVSLLYVMTVVVLWSIQADDNYWTTRSQVSLVLLLILAVGASLFSLWSVYLMIRFAISFRSAARKLRAKWRGADHSLAEDARQ